MKATYIITPAILALILLGTACKKESAQEPELPEEPVVLPQKTLYTLNNEKGLEVYSALCYVNTYEPGSSVPTGSTLWCNVGVRLDQLASASQAIERTYGEVEIVRKPFSSTSIVGIDLITNADYDEEHPKGSSLNDIMELHYIGPDGKYYSTIDLIEYFKIYPTLDINDGFVFRLKAKALPPQKNHIVRTDLANYDSLLAVDVTLKLTLEDGTALLIDPLPDLLDA